MAKPEFGCGNAECGVSTGICESLTFGSGRLTFNGYWEKPCVPCARAWEQMHPNEDPCWPFRTQNVEVLAADIKKECDEEAVFFS